MSDEEVSKKRGGKKYLQQDDLIGRLVPDPGNPDVKRVVGLFLGEGGQATHWRLYLSTGLNHYLEFPKEDTIDAQRFASGHIVVWVKPETRIREVSSASAPVEFLQGSIRAPRTSARMRDQLGLGAGGGCGPSPAPTEPQTVCMPPICTTQSPTPNCPDNSFFPGDCPGGGGGPII